MNNAFTTHNINTFVLGEILYVVQIQRGAVRTANNGLLECGQYSMEKQLILNGRPVSQAVQYSQTFFEVPTSTACCCL